MATGGELFEVLYEYTGREGDSQFLPVAKGDIVRVIKKEDAYFIVEKDGTTGKVPKRKLQACSEAASAKKDQANPTSQQHDPKYPKMPNLSMPPILSPQELQEINRPTTSRRRFGSNLKEISPSSNSGTGVALYKIAKPHKYEDFQIIRELSRGAFGRVLVVRLKESPEIVLVMKRVPYFNDKDRKAADEEVSMLKLAGSKYTVNYVESFTFDVDLCIVMEYCDGGNLREMILKTKTLTVKERKNICYNIFYQVLMGLKHLHSLDIVHRDLKPENVFLDKDGNAKTGDFGLALKMESKSQVYAAGTQNYQPSEAHTQNKMTDKSDVWSLGVIITELLTGIHPFEGRTMDVTIANIKSGKYRPLPDFVQGDLKDMIISMINTDPSKRPSASLLLDSDMMQLLAKIETEKEEKLQIIEEKQKEKKRADDSETKTRVANIKIRTVEERAHKAEQEKNDANEKIRVNEEKIRLLEQQKNEINQKTLKTEEKLNQSEQAKKEADKKAEEDKIKFEAEIKKLNEQLTQTRLPCPILKKIGEDLKKPVAGTDEQKKEILQFQENDSKLISRTFEPKQEDEIKKRVIESGIVEGFISIFEKQELSTIVRASSQAFIRLLIDSSDEVKLLVKQLKPFPGLFRLFDHTERLVLCDAIGSIYLILVAGATSSSEDQPHPHFDVVQACDGVKKIYSQFQNKQEEYEKDRAAFCIGYLYRARECTDVVMLKDIFTYLKT
ncbi:MAG: putative serine/threonine-protein kinase Nek3, partial [Streblomastix strix]